jgi:hypothetical protein
MEPEAFHEGQALHSFHHRLLGLTGNGSVQGSHGCASTNACIKITGMEFDECKETTMHDINNIKEEMRIKAHVAEEAYNKDDEMLGGCVQRVQCSQQ